MRGILSSILTLILFMSASIASAQTDIIIPPGNKPPVIGQNLKVFPQAVNAQTVCETSCSGSVTTMKFFDGNMTCGRSVNLPCNPYACDSIGKHCNKGCSVDGDCSTGNVCNKSTGQCVIPTYRCSEDGNSVVGSDGSSVSCFGTKCRAGNCILFCNSSDECSSGFTCDPTSRSCVVYRP